MVGLPGFEPGSIEPKSTSLDQASRQPLYTRSTVPYIELIFKTISKVQHLSKANQKAIWNRNISIGKHCNLSKPVEVENFVYSMNVKNNYKNKLFSAYQYLCHANEILWTKPKKLREENFVIHIPTEARIDTIISSAGPVYSVVFNLSKYGLRPDEIHKLTLRDLDLGQGNITVPTSKLGAQRTIQLKKQTIDLLKEYVAKKHISLPDQKLFGSVDKIKRAWLKYRYRAYSKFKDAELLKIRLYDLRHWYATITYIATRDIFQVKYLLGHRRLDNTLIYIHLAKGLTSYSEDDYCKASNTIEEAKALIESGFEYVTEVDGVKLFKKRK